VLDTTSIWSQLMGVATDAIGVANRVMTVVNAASTAVSVAGKLTALSDGGGLPTTSPPVTSTLLPGGTFLCPTSISPFQMAFQSDMDSPFWRGVLPLESVFPATWLPGMREVGSGLTQTWGSVWPRQGNIYQTHPVKASAVLATRVGDIISNRAQPHIYTPLNLTPGGYRWFGAQGISERVAQTRWQRVFPNPASSCGGFGANDALSLSSYGDGNNAAGQGAIWNAWRRQECCQRPSRSTYLFGVEI
jgi:integrating conjugative element protein (TIGR03756 family)